MPNKHTRCPACLNSGVIISPALAGATANEIRVGGTSISMNEPDIESLPPIAAAPNVNCASNAPSRAAKGLPQRSGCLPRRSKYSWNERYTLLGSHPAATSFEIEDVTAAIAAEYVFISEW